MPFNFQSIEGVLVVLEKSDVNVPVGTLAFNNGQFRFEYKKSYLNLNQSIALGPEMPLTRKVYESNHLFIPFADRIPSRDNPAYSEYCKAQGISKDERDPLILLTTIAARGPSSFLFKPIFNESFTPKDLKQFRQNLGMSIREFAHCFDFSYAGIVRVEAGSGGREILKRAEIYAKYPQIALDQLHRRDGQLHHKKMTQAKQWLQTVV